VDNNYLLLQFSKFLLIELNIILLLEFVQIRLLTSDAEAIMAVAFSLYGFCLFFVCWCQHLRAPKKIEVTYVKLCSENGKFK